MIQLHTQIEYPLFSDDDKTWFSTNRFVINIDAHWLTPDNVL